MKLLPRKRSSAVLALALVTAATAACLGADHRVYDYTPAFSDLSGVLSLKIFPGRPNYRSIEEGDHPDRCFILKLRPPISLREGKAPQDKFDAVTGIQEVQLVFSKPAQRPRCERLIGKTLRIHGRLIPARVGREHLPTLIIVYAISEENS
jgi:hypothetical protein